MTVKSYGRFQFMGGDIDTLQDGVRRYYAASKNYNNFLASYATIRDTLNVPYMARLRIENEVAFTGGSGLWEDYYVRFGCDVWNRSDDIVYMTIGGVTTTIAKNAQVYHTVLYTSLAHSANGSIDKTWDFQVLDPSATLADIQVTLGVSQFITGSVYYEVGVTWWPINPCLIKKVSTMDFEEEIKRTSLIDTPEEIKKISSQRKEE